MVINSVSSHLLPCAYKTIFGIDCPICGFQRALLLLCQGDFIGSFKMYAPLFPVLSLIIVALLRVIKHNWVSSHFLGRYSLVILVIVMINYFIKLFA